MPERLQSIRNRVLQTTFDLLYSRLSFLHEPTGRIVFGDAWHARRFIVVPEHRTGLLLDIGCGEGRLLSALTTGFNMTLGVEPSSVMAHRAAKRGCAVVCASAQKMPLHDNVVAHVVATYPGPWILDDETWREIARVTQPGATITILLGGDIVRGRGAAIRGWLLRLANGRTAMPGDLPTLGNAGITGNYRFIEDEWGTAIVWSGVRGGDPASARTSTVSGS